jgi:hypothetical protein
MSKQPNTPEVVEVDRAELEGVIARAEQSLDKGDADTIRAVFESYEYITGLLDDKDISIARLLKLTFGSSSEKTDAVLGDSSSAEEAGNDQTDNDAPTSEDELSNASDTDSPEQELPAELTAEASPPTPGHGRNGADAYRGAKQVDVPHDCHAPGDRCPECVGGKLYDKTPGVLIRIVGQAPLQATIYHLQKLRCHLCGKIFTASAPPEAGDAKYDATAASMIGLLKYGSGLPFNRLDRLQGTCQIPLPASTQWDVLAAVVPSLFPAYQELIRQAACGDVLYNDDTPVKILAWMGKRKEKRTTDFDDDSLSPERTGLFTTGVVSTCAGWRIALFFSGRQHAGENLRDVLQHRDQELNAPIQMCDGLSRNVPKELETILSNCIAHGRREFVDLYSRFPDECGHVLRALKVVYHNDAVAREEKMSAEERLQHHQAESQSTMDELHAWMQRQFDEKLVEPNSALGGAIKYMLKRWSALTLFLRKAGAPLDNNICERALKKAILHRKNSLFYKTERGAGVGDLFMSLIYTCELCGANALDYLTQLQENADQVAAHPECWMPWNYRDMLNAMPAAA